MSKLTKLFEYQSASNLERKRLLNKESFKKVVLETMPKEQKELLISDANDAGQLLQTEVYSKIVEGQKEAVVIRDILPTIPCDTNQVRVTYMSGSTGYAMDMSEGGAIPLDESAFKTKNIDIKKIGTRPLITNEMIEDGLWNLVEWELVQAGRRMENKLNRNVIDVLVNNCATVVQNSTPTVQSIAAMRKGIFTNHWNPTVGVICPEVEVILTSGNQFLEYRLAGDQQAFRTGEMGTVMGINFKRLGIDGSATVTQTWGGNYDAANEVGMLVFDPSAFAFLAIRRDLEVEQYKDPIHDLVGLSATMRFGSKVIHESAGAITDHA